MINSIREVRRAQLNGEAGTFGLRVYIVNFAAPTDFPRKFFYNGCTHAVGGGRFCSRTVEGGFKCQHNSVENGTWTEMFRFDVFLVDGSVNQDCPPLRAAIFDAASSLLGTPIEEFCVLDSPEQFAIVCGMSTEMHLADVSVRLNTNRQLVIQTLSLRPKRIETTTGGQDSSRKSTSSSQSTPSAYLTPRPGGESSSGSALTSKSTSSSQSTPSAYLTPQPGGESSSGSALTSGASASTSGTTNADIDSYKSTLHKLIEKLDISQL